MLTSATPNRAAAFLAMHRPGAGFILPNAWDGGSARILEQAGFAAIATTSAGIAFSRGAADGTMDRSEMLDCIARIVSAVACPVSADLESGYGTTADDVAATVAAAVKLGVVGGNLEDVTRPGELLPVEAACERLEAARTAAPAGSFVLTRRLPSGRDAGILSVIIEVFMARPLSLADLPDDVARFAEAQLASGRFSTVEEVIRAGAEALRQREDEAKLAALRAALEEGEQSGRSDYSLEKVLAELDAETAH